MLQPDVTLTDYALAVECAVLAVVLHARNRTGAGGRITSFYSLAFLALALASVLGAVFHGFFSQSKGFAAETIWIGTMLVIGAVNFVIWLIAAEIQLNTLGRRLIFWIAAAQWLAYSLYVTTVSEDFLVATLNSVPPMLFLLFGYVRIVLNGGKAGARLGLLGVLLVFLASALQHLGIGISADYFGPNALYHVIELVAFLLLFLSVPDLQDRSGNE